jgi:5-methylcytosine-specific restriction endonuclease McrA
MPHTIRSTRKFIQLPPTARPHFRRKRWRVAQFEMLPWCDYCDKPLTKNLATVDHVVPRSRGGGDDPGNFALACKKCQKLKGNKTLGECGMRLVRNRGRSKNGKRLFAVANDHRPNSHCKILGRMELP